MKSSLCAAIFAFITVMIQVSGHRSVLKSPVFYVMLRCGPNGNYNEVFTVVSFIDSPIV